MAAKRRMGPENAVARMALMDAAEEVMRQQGYAAVSARSVAAQAGLKYQLVFYYFETMDDLLVATYRRNSEKMWAHIEMAAKSEQPLHALWRLFSYPFDGAGSLEFMAAANHSAALHAEWIGFVKRLRRLLTEAFAGKHLDIDTEGPPPTPLAVVSIFTAVASIMSFEAALGIDNTHKETRALIGWALDQIEPEKARRPKGALGSQSGRRAPAKGVAKKKPARRPKEARA